MATNSLENLTAVLSKIHEVTRSNTNPRFNHCLSRIHESDSCNGLRFIGDIVKASQLYDSGICVNFSSLSDENAGEWCGILLAPVIR
jgi:hypothetical protein